MTIDKAIDDFRVKHGKKADIALTQLGKSLDFVQAINSPIGQELLKDDVIRLDELMEKIYNENATSQELAEFRYLKGRIAKVKTRLNAYVKQTQEIVNGTKKSSQ